jgi:hypothetical protein
MTIEIENFPAAVERSRGSSVEEARCIYSEKKKLYHGPWRAKIYPCGNANGLGTHLSLFLELLKGVKGPTQFAYRFAIFHANDPTKSVIRDHCSEYRELDSWGWNQAVALTELLGDPEFLFGERSTLRLEISLRPESYKVLYEITGAAYDAVKAKHAALRERGGSPSET